VKEQARRRNSKAHRAAGRVPSPTGYRRRLAGFFPLDLSCSLITKP
jgi:hypothetical protein